MASRLFIPDEATGDSTALPVLAHNAEWAQTFLPSARPAQRIRYQQDKTAYISALQDQQEAHQQHLIETNKTAQNLWLRQQAMEQRAKEAEAALKLKTQHADMERQQFELRSQATAAKMEADHLAEMRRLNDDTLKHQASAAADSDTIGLQRKILGAAETYGFNTPEFHKSTVQAGLEHPAADQTFVQQHVMPSQQALAARARDEQKIADKAEQPARALPAELTTKYAKLRANLDEHAANIETERATNIAENKANVPYSKSAEMKAASTEASILERAYPELKTLTETPASAPTSPDSASGAPVAANAPALPPEAQQAVAWATANPDDPRAQKIKQMHGIE